MEYYNKQLGIGPGGIKCSCCTDFPYKRGNVKRQYRKLKRTIMKRDLQKELNQEEMGALHSVWTTHSHLVEGGRKTHIIDEDEYNPLCGWDVSHLLANMGGVATESWINTDDGDLCLKCKRIALKRLTTPNQSPAAPNER